MLAIYFQILKLCIMKTLKRIELPKMNLDPNAKLSNEHMGGILGGGGCICHKNPLGLNDGCLCLKNSFGLCKNVTSNDDDTTPPPSGTTPYPTTM